MKKLAVIVGLLIVGLLALNVAANQEQQLVVTLKNRHARVDNIKKIVNNKYREGYRVKHLEIFSYEDGQSYRTEEECIIIFEKK